MRITEVDSNATSKKLNQEEDDDGKFDFVFDVAEELYEYLKVRAAAEGVSYELDPMWLGLQLGQLYLGYGFPRARMFGVCIEGEQLMYDEQEPSPGFFAAWKQSRKKESLG